MELPSDEHIFNLIKDGKEEGINQLFHKYYKSIVIKIHRMLMDQQIAEDLAQELFMDFWTKRDQIAIQQSIGSYLNRAAYNRALNFIKSKKLSFNDIDSVNEIEFMNPDEYEEESDYDLQLAQVYKSIESLPEKCRIVFSMSRFEEMTYAMIAKELGISIKTVENQISKALKYLRNNIKKE